TTSSSAARAAIAASTRTTTRLADSAGCWACAVGSGCAVAALTPVSRRSRSDRRSPTTADRRRTRLVATTSTQAGNRPLGSAYPSGAAEHPLFRFGVDRPGVAAQAVVGLARTYSSNSAWLH